MNALDKLPRMKGWVARDYKTGVLCWYSEMPTAECGIWDPGLGYEVKLDKSFLPEVTYDNSPQEYEIILNKI